MRRVLYVFSALLLQAATISDNEISRRVAEISEVSAKQPPLMALDTLLATAVMVKPYLPQESQQLYRAALAVVDGHPDLRVTSAVAKSWLELDPASAEMRILRLPNWRSALWALMNFHERREDRGRAAALAARAIRSEPDRTGESFTLRKIAEVNPREAADLLEELAKLPVGQKGLPDSATGLLDGLAAAADSQPEAVKTALKRVAAIAAAPEFGNGADMRVRLEVKIGEAKLTTASSRDTLLLFAALVAKQIEPNAPQDELFSAWATELATIHSAQEARTALRSRSIDHELIRLPTKGWDIPLDLPLEDAVTAIRKLDNPRMRLAALFRYATVPARSEAELGQVIAKLSEMAAECPPEADPYWFLQALLNNDDRLRPGGKRWALPVSLRPAVYRAAAREAQRMDRDPDRLAELVQFMRKERIEVPAELHSARARWQFEELRDRMEQRYDFTLAAFDGRARRLQNERGKVVVLNFWATWCGPCRAEMPAFHNVYAELHERGVEVFAITDEPLDALRGFLEKNRITFPVLVDAQRKVFDHYRVNGLPQTFVIDREGRIVKHWTDAVVESDLRTTVAAALGESPTSPPR
jgi:cytochrome c biogenesis protein CcmG, thiol:disulfide interchange protein DsbE